MRKMVRVYKYHPVPCRKTFKNMYSILAVMYLDYKSSLHYITAKVIATVKKESQHTTMWHQMTMKITKLLLLLLAIVPSGEGDALMLVQGK